VVPKPDGSKTRRPFLSRVYRVGLAVALVLAAAQPLQAQSPTERVAQFARAAPELTRDTVTAEGTLSVGEAAEIELALTAGAPYTVVAFCDPACSDLDLVLLDPAGEGVESDIFPDPEPVLAFTATSTGAFTLTVAMVACSEEPCRYAVGIFRGSLQEGAGVPAVHMAERRLRFQEDLGREGYQELPMEETGSLDQEHELRFPVRLEAGVDYQIAAICDDPCSDLDLTLFDPWGGVVAEDRFPDATPLLGVFSEEPTTFRLGVTMVECRENPCNFRVMFFGRGERIGPGGVLLPGRVLSAATHEGRLEEGDERRGEGPYWDAYTAEAEAGQIIVLDLGSPDFPTRVILQTPGGEQHRSERPAEGETNSYLLLRAPESGAYTIIVTSVEQAASGRYTLQIAVAEGPRNRSNP
jgi:hypothetical protein